MAQPRISLVQALLALIAVREDLFDLKSNLGPEGYWHGQPDLEDRVENWEFNTNRRITDILAEGGEVLETEQSPM